MKHVQLRFRYQNESAALGARGFVRHFLQVSLMEPSDAIATDHAPHEPALKDVEFDRAPFGITGFETALSLALEQLVHTGRAPLMRMRSCSRQGPRALSGSSARSHRPGRRSHRFFPSIVRGPSRKRIRQQSRNSPFDGRAFKGGPVATIVSAA